MSKKKFNFGQVLNEISQRDKFISFTKEIDINQINVNEKNFYGAREIEELAESIKMCGLLHNIVVNELPNGRYLLISGERRYKAYYSLYQENKNEYNKIPCKILNIEDEDLKQWYLMEGNKQRTKNDFEQMEEIKQRQEYYEKLKAKGYKFGKKTRTLIAEDMGLSETQVQRFKTAEKNLSPQIKGSIKEKDFNLAEIKKVSEQPKEEQHHKINEIVQQKQSIKISKANKKHLHGVDNGYKYQIYSINNDDFTKKIAAKIDYITGKLENGIDLDVKHFEKFNVEIKKINAILDKITSIVLENEN